MTESSEISSLVLESTNKNTIEEEPKELQALKIKQKLKGKIIKKDEIKNQHNGKCINDLLYTNNGKLFSASDDKTIGIYNWNKDEKQFEYENSLKGHTDYVLTLCKTKDPLCILSGSRDETIKMWQVSTYKCIRTFEGHSDAIFHIIIYSDDKIISASADKSIKIWNQQGECLNTLKGHTDEVAGLIELKDKRLVSCSCDNQVLFWNMNTYQIETNHTINNVECRYYGKAVLYLKEDDKLLVAGIGEINVIDLNEYRVIKTIKDNLNGNKIPCILYLYDRTLIAGLFADNNQLVCYDENLEFKSIIPYPYSSRISSSVKIDNENMFVTAGYGGYLILWEY